MSDIMFASEHSEPYAISFMKLKIPPLNFPEELIAVTAMIFFNYIN